MEEKKRKRQPVIVPQGTQQETGVTRFIKKTKQTELIKDAKINNKVDFKNKSQE